MSTKLIQTKDYLLLIKKVYGFKVGDWNYEEDNTIPVYQFDYNIDEYPGNKIVAYYPLTDEAEELNLPLLPNPSIEPDIVTLAIEIYGDNYHSLDQIEAFKRGYKVAQQSNKQFSLEDMKKAIEMATWINPNNTDRFYNKEEIIQSISTQKLPKEFIPEYEINTFSAYGHDTHVLKTILNSEGKKEIVGTYKY